VTLDNQLGRNAGSDTSRPTAIEFRGVVKIFRDHRQVVPALGGVDFAVRKGEVVTVVGPSGCGKSTILNLVAGLIRPSVGEVLYCNAPVPKPNTHVGYVTQSNDLMPWRTVFNNVALALEIRGASKATIDREVRRVLKVVGLEGFEDAYPAQLSGGMRQRAGLARTLVYDPEVILADEPFAALDSHLRLVLQQEFQSIVVGTDRAVVFITHDLQEAILMGDRVIVMGGRPGRVQRIIDVPFERPRNLLHLQFSPEFEQLHHELWNLMHHGTTPPRRSRTIERSLEEGAAS
jgi:NitT/TauT family transport system ATP-binding protein